MAPKHLIVIPDEEAPQGGCEDWGRLGPRVTRVRVDVPGHGYAYHYRLVATIALAEVARQVGQRAPDAGRRPRRPGAFYERALEVLAQEQAETVFLEDLAPY